MASGTVKWFNRKRGFGFIEPDEGDKDAFVHISAVKRAGLLGLDEGQRMEYELMPLDDGRLMADRLKPMADPGDDSPEPKSELEVEPGPESGRELESGPEEGARAEVAG